MNSKQENWIRTFDIPETRTHKDGYTIYKIISFLYPESCPDAVTKLIVWKRFNDFKTLHKTIKKLQKNLKIEEKPPNLPKSVIFKRFHVDTISTRKNSILSLLDYIGKYSEFFTSTIFAKFFETDLFDEEENDTDSFCSYNSTNLIPQQQDTISLNNKQQLNPILEGYYLKQEENPEYLINASLHLNVALELENDKNFEEAYKAYKTTVDILLKGVENDDDYDRKRLIRFKIEKSLNQAEKLYNMYLAPEVQQFNEQKNIELNNSVSLINNSVLKGSLYNLYKYKVIKIIWPLGMLVLHSEEQKLFYIKVVHKSVNFSYNELILPQNVPNMVKLINHYNTDDAVYLVLEYFSSNKLRDVLANQQQTNNNNLSISETTKYEENDEQISFSELLNVYSQTDDDDENVEEEACCCNKEETDEDFEFISKTDLEETDFSSVFYPYNNISSASSTITNNTVEFEEIDKKKLISEKQVIKWASQLLLALEKLHSLGVNCNGYLHINHLLIDEENNLHLTYKCSINNHNNEIFSYNNNNSINSNLAPEVYNLNFITEAADWWSFGAILYELLVGIPLSEIYTNGFGNYTDLMIPKYVSIEGKSLLKQLLNFEPDERLGGKLIGIEYLKVHPFFRGINWEKI